jgi:hypothetical protein
MVGVKVCQAAPAVSHLLFVDDFLIFMRADLQNAMTLRRTLQDYCDSSGQMVSEAKSSIFFSPRTKVETRVEVCSELNILTKV